jgi:hypothetical protein
VSVGERLVTVLVTVAVPEAADPEDAAVLVADAAMSSALDVVHAVGVEGHLPLAGSVVTTSTGAPAVVVTVGEGSVVLRHLDGDVQRAPLRALAPDLLDPAGTVRRLVADDAGP